MKETLIIAGLFLLAFGWSGWAWRNFPNKAVEQVEMGSDLLGIEERLNDIQTTLAIPTHPPQPIILDTETMKHLPHCALLTKELKREFEWCQDFCIRVDEGICITKIESL